MNGKMTQEEYLEHIGKMTEDEREEELMRRAGELRGRSGIWFKASRPMLRLWRSLTL